MHDHDCVISGHRPRPEAGAGGSLGSSAARPAPGSRGVGPPCAPSRDWPSHPTLRCPPVSRNPMTPRRGNPGRLMHPSRHPAIPFGSAVPPTTSLVHADAVGVRPPPGAPAARATFFAFHGDKPAGYDASGLLAGPSAAAPCRQLEPQRSAGACVRWWMFASCRLPGGKGF